MFFSRRAGDKRICRGDPTGFDFDTDDFTLTWTWQPLDLSTKVPVGAKYVCFSAEYKTTGVGYVLQFRPAENSNDYNMQGVQTQLTMLKMMGNFVIKLNPARIIEYRGSDVGEGYAYLVVTDWIM